MFKFKKLISLDYLLHVNSVMLTRSDKLFFVIGAVFVIVAIVLKVAALSAPNPVDAIVRNKFYKMFLSIGLAEVVWFGARYENVKFFGSHLIALLILLVGLAWFVKLLISLLRNYRGDKTVWEKEQVKLKYLPK